MSGLNVNLLDSYNGKGFAAEYAKYAKKADTDVNGNSLELTLDSDDNLSQVGGKDIAGTIRFVTTSNTYAQITAIISDGLTPILVGGSGSNTYYSTLKSNESGVITFETMVSTTVGRQIRVDKVDSGNTWSTEYLDSEVYVTLNYPNSDAEFTKWDYCIRNKIPIYYVSSSGSMDVLVPIVFSYANTVGTTDVIRTDFIILNGSDLIYRERVYSRTSGVVTTTQYDNHIISTIASVEDTDTFSNSINVSTDVATGNIDSVGKSYTLEAGQTIEVKFGCDFRIANAAYTGGFPEHCYELVLYKTESGETTIYSRCSLCSFYLEDQQSGYNDIKASTASLIYKNTSSSQITLTLGVLSYWGTAGLTGSLGMKNVIIGDIIFQ